MSEPDGCPDCGTLRSWRFPHYDWCVHNAPAALSKAVKSWRRTAGDAFDREKRLREQVTLWQGKFAMVKHENNALRRKAAILAPEPPETP